MFAFKENLKAPFLTKLKQLDHGAHYLKSEADSGAVDYIRGNFISKKDFASYDMQSLTKILEEKLKPYINATNGSKLLCIGSRFPQGIHDIHMN